MDSNRAKSGVQHRFTVEQHRDSRPPPIVIRSDRSIGRFNNRGPAIRNRYRPRTSCEFSAVINGRTPTRKIATERYTTILRTFACGAITSFGQQCSKIITNLSLSLSLKILATMSKRATISKFSQCWKASRVERHSSLSHKWCFDGASTECTAAVITGIARLTTNLPSFTVKSDQLTRYISCPLAANEAEWGEIGEKRSRRRSNVNARTFIPACFPLPFPAELGRKR